jgi:hypothetical protein
MLTLRLWSIALATYLRMDVNGSFLIHGNVARCCQVRLPPFSLAVCRKYVLAFLIESAARLHQPALD